MRRIRIAQIGMGHDHASDKMDNLKAMSDEYEILGVYEPHPEILRERGCRPGYEGVPLIDLERLLSLPELDAVNIETDVPEINRYARICLEHGINIHMDKPAGEVFSEYEAILNLAEQKRLTVQMSYMYRYNPAIRYAMDAARSGELGRIFEMDTQMSTMHPLEYRLHYGYVQGGCMLIFGCHLIDLIVRVLGAPERVTPFVRSTDTPGGIPDNCLAVLEYPDAACTVRVSSLEVNGFGRRQMVICGTEGTIAVTPLERPTVITRSMRNDITNIYSDQKKTLDMPVPVLRHQEEYRVLAKVLRGEIKAPYSYEHDLAVHRATLLACGIALR